VEEVAPLGDMPSSPKTLVAWLSHALPSYVSAWYFRDGEMADFKFTKNVAKDMRAQATELRTGDRMLQDIFDMAERYDPLDYDNGFQGDLPEEAFAAAFAITFAVGRFHISGKSEFTDKILLLAADCFERAAFRMETPSEEPEVVVEETPTTKRDGPMFARKYRDSLGPFLIHRIEARDPDDE
jgi:hypothetical protein